MATKNNICVNRDGYDTGSGTKDLYVYAAEYTGRDNRSATFKADGTGSYSEISSDNMLTVTQLGLGPFIRLTNQTIGASGGQVEVGGSSNLREVKMIASAENDLSQYLSSARINDVSVTKQQLLDGYTVVGDPGASGSYGITLLFNIPSSSSSVSISRQCDFKVDDTHTTQLVITQQSTSTSHRVWFGNGASAVFTSTTLNVALNPDGEIIGTNNDPRVLADDASVSWTIQSVV